MSENSRTRFDRFRRNRLLFIVGVFVVITVGAALMAALASAGERRSADLRPRNIDIWMVYPEDTVRFATLFYPQAPEGGINTVGVVDAAGPLYEDPADVTEEEVIGGDLLNSEVSSIEANPGFSYTLYTLDHTLTSESPDPYGVEVEVQNAPYTNPTAVPGTWTAQFFAGGQSRFEQVIVAVALPTDAADITTTTPTPQGILLEPYRTVTLNDWVVYYYDTTDAEPQSLIYVEYSPSSSSPPPLDPVAVDRRR
jgi:hypothetical protein